VLTGFVLGLAAFTLFVAAKVVVFRSIPVDRRLAAIVRVFGACALLACLASVGLSTLPGARVGLLEGCVYAIGTMLCLFVLYMPFYYVIATSLSVETLVLIYCAPNGALPAEHFRGRPALLLLLGERLESMAASGNLAKAGDGYVATEKGRRVARFFSALKAYWRLGPGG
jgi:hypothetical protein